MTIDRRRAPRFSDEKVGHFFVDESSRHSAQTLYETLQAVVNQAGGSSCRFGLRRVRTRTVERTEEKEREETTASGAVTVASVIIAAALIFNSDRWLLPLLLRSFYRSSVRVRWMMAALQLLLFRRRVRRSVVETVEDVGGQKDGAC